MRYFRIIADNARFADRWFLDEPVTKDGQAIDAREFRYGRPYVGSPPFRIPVQSDGIEVEFNLAAFDMPVVSAKIIRLLEGVAQGEFEAYPVTIGSSLSGYAILNVIHRESCVDDERSQSIRWKQEDGRPDKIGSYRTIYSLIIDSARTHGRQLFRVEGFEVALIASEKVKQALGEIPELAVIFESLE